jgi:hypothetical protein
MVLVRRGTAEKTRSTLTLVALRIVAHIAQKARHCRRHREVRFKEKRGKRALNFDSKCRMHLEIPT